MFWWWVVGAVTAAVSYVAVKKAKDAAAEAERAAEEARNRGILLNKDSNIADIPVIYGERKVGGTRVFRASGGGTKNEYQYIVLVLGIGEVESIGDIYLDDTLSTDSKYSGHVTINKYVGTDNQTADSMFTAAGIGWTSAHRLRGVAYLAVRLKWNSDVFTGTPTITAIVKGRKVYDPRTTTTAYSTNPALCLRDYLTNTRYGKGLAASDINDTLFNAAANKCDEQIYHYSGATQTAIFECNAVIDTGRTLFDNTKVLRSGMRAFMPFQNGQYGLVIDDEGSSTFSFNLDNIIGSLSINSESKSNKYNRVIATFVNPDANWQSDQVQWPPVDSAEEATYLSEDNNVVLEGQINLETVTNPYLAEDMAEITVKRSRNAKGVRFKATSEALNVTVGQIIDITHPSPGWTAKPFRVINLALLSDGTVTIDAIEHQDTIYPWSMKTEADEYPDTNLPDPTVAEKPGVPTATEELYVTKQGAGVKAKVEVTWAASDDAFAREYEVQYKENGETKWHHAGNVSDTDIDILDITPGRYYFRVRMINTIGIRSAWSTTPAIEIFGLAAKPAALANVSLQNVSSLTVVSWDQSTDLDVRIGGYIEVRHSSLTTGATWSDSVSIGNSKLNGTATVAVLPFQPGTYLVRATDSSGVQSDVASVVNEGDTLQSFTSVGQVQEHPSFPGTFDDTIKVGSILKLEGQDDIDDWGNIDDVTNFDVGPGGIDTGGVYYFSTVIDAGTIKRQQVTRHIKSVITQPLDDIDSRTGNIDDWADFDGTGTANGDCKVYVAHTNDDPSGSPTWSGWELLNVNEYNKRAFKFKAELSVSDLAYNIEISELSVSAKELP